MSLMTAGAIAPSAVALLAGLTVRRLVPPRRALDRRLGPYAGLLRSRLGSGPVDVEAARALQPITRAAWLQILGPSVEATVRALVAVMGSADDGEVVLRLRQAGFVEPDPHQHRMRQLLWAVIGGMLGALVGAAVIGNLGGTVLMMLCFGFPASTLQRARVDRAIARRRARIRNEVYTVAQLLAVHLRTGRGPVESVRVVCVGGAGPLSADLREALGWISGGVTPAVAYQRLADTIPEPSAARLLRLLATAAPSGGDVGQALLAVADDLRAARRDEIARRAVRRRTAMLVPLLLLIAPVMLLFVGAALPTLVLGVGQ